MNELTENQVNDEDIDNGFNLLLEELTDKEWWDWVKGWLDEELIVDIYKNWEIDIKRDEIDNLKGIIANRKEELK